MGYGREAYVWSMFAAFGLFTAGAVVSIMHGIQQIIAPEPAPDFLVAYVVLAVAFCTRRSFLCPGFPSDPGGSPSARSAHPGGGPDQLRSHPAPFVEDAAALVGLVVAFAGVFLHQVTGSCLPDAGAR